MRHTPSITTGIPSALSRSVRPRRTHSIVRAIIDALHHSRRLQAESVLFQYRHLIDRSGRCIVCEANNGSGGNKHADK